jgi:hypothetical protein
MNQLTLKKRFIDLNSRLRRGHTSVSMREVLAEERFAHWPLVSVILCVRGGMADFKERVRTFFFDVVLSPHPCPVCGGRLKMKGQSLCSCSCGKRLDPTIAFQRSPCCGANPLRKTFHYARAECHEMVPSRFIFEESVFDSAYSREMMREHRRKAREEWDAMKRFLAESRSGTLLLSDEPLLESLDGLTEDLDAFIQGFDFTPSESGFEAKSTFSMEQYRCGQGTSSRPGALDPRE